MLLQLSYLFPLYPPPTSPPPTSIIHPLTIVLVHGSIIYGLWPIPSPSFNPSPLPTSLFTAVSLFRDSMHLVLFFSLINFVHEVPLIGEIISYLSFTDWLISLSIMFSSSIHAVAKCRNPSLCCTVFLCVDVPQLFLNHSSTDGHLGCFQILAMETVLLWTLGCIFSFELVFQDS